MLRGWQRACEQAGYIWIAGVWQKAEAPPAVAADPTTALPMEAATRKTLSIKPRAVSTGADGAATGPVIKTKMPARSITVPTLAYTAPEASDIPFE